MVTPGSAGVSTDCHEGHVVGGGRAVGVPADGLLDPVEEGGGGRRGLVEELQQTMLVEEAASALRASVTPSV